MSHHDNPDAHHLGFLSIDVFNRAMRRVKVLEAAIRRHRQICQANDGLPDRPEITETDRQLWSVLDRDPCKRKTVYKRSKPRSTSDLSS